MVPRGPEAHFSAPAPPSRPTQTNLHLDMQGWPLRPRRRWRKIVVAPPVIQLALHLEDHGCTPLMLRVEATLRRLATCSDVTPSYELLNTLAGGQNRSSVFRAVHRLAKLKRVHIQQEPSRRRFVLLFDGRATEWSPFRPGHSPNRRGKGPKPSVAKAPRKRERPSSGLGQRPPAVDIVVPLVLRPAETCQYASWDDHGKVTNRYCGAATLRGSDWCEYHEVVVYGKVRKRTKRA